MLDTTVPSRLAGSSLVAGYGTRTVIDSVDVRIPDGSLTAIIGPNACGKSTLLRVLARLLKPESGAALLDGTDIHSLPTKQVARRIGLLPQAPIAPDGITVEDLVARGRHPHQSVFSQWSRQDEEQVATAMSATGITDLAERHVDELSGGQRQRVWIALALAQDTPILLLDEPTTFLDIAHQIEILDLVDRLRGTGRTVVAVLHDLNQAAQYADHLVAMRDGRIIAQGSPDEVITAESVLRVFGLRARVILDPDTGKPVVLPRSRRTDSSPLAE
ncbi:MAG: ABC transporter ATP-binding protein [Brachybacterium tyrofermentans]